MHAISNIITSTIVTHDADLTITPSICRIITTAGLTPPT
jgi:hypothetical protein